ncbi:hypothetical protein HHTV1_52 [Haloarcula hispanica tailed virus 1]|uniref:Uncharacterized protein n=1 Tax=Haloarcula hispanica tailed virus 1 TaxID=1273750 RepID=R4TGE3_9CAUD|nr:hypothetical protein M198_gp52 [Haloarcula hispanica tailed virus 1]AGM11306.1 hypothetical protein HHTV1_52 [Haloarcula hispanica tailed virus 1]
MANKEINPDTWEDYPGEAGNDDVETIPNKERGCGYLKAGNSYIRSDIDSDGDGTLPGFVIFTDDEGSLHPIPYKESLPRGYETLNGSNFLAAAETQRNVVCLYPGDADAEESHQEAHQQALEKMAEVGLYRSAEAAPSSELDRHLDRMRVDGFDGRDHWGAIPAANSADLLMRVGKSYYDEPWDFIDETLELGLNKGISVHSNKSPPVIQPGRTRVWLIHPHACGEDMPGVIGFVYLTRTIYTLDKDGNVPEYAQDYADAGKLDVVDIGQPEPLEDDDERDYEDIAEAHQGLDSFEEPEEDADSEETTDDEAGAGGDSEPEPQGEADIEPQQIEDLEKASLGELANENWIPVNQPPEEYDAVHGSGNLVAIVDGRKVSASNNFTWEPEEQHGSSVVGPYTVEVRETNGERMLHVEK